MFDAVVEVDIDLAGRDFEECLLVVLEFFELLNDGGDNNDGSCLL
ncbi:MAG: hypothetical protein ACK5OC_14440 [Pirellula sp.]